MSGPLFGTWPTGAEVSVDGPSYVPAGEALFVEAGVVISFKTSDPLVVYGEFEAHGSQETPVIVRTNNEWAGFQFEPEPDVWRELEYVVMLDEDPIADRVIVAAESNIRLTNCYFRARRAALHMTGGRIQADDNKFLTIGLYSSTVKINHLMNLISDPCAEVGGNKLTNNLIWALVPLEDNHWQPSSFTSGLFINGSTNLCLQGNVITVDAPQTTIGAYFGEAAQQGTMLAVLDFCVVTVHSTEGTPRGVYEANEGSLRILRCTIDVARNDPDSPYQSAGVVATNEASVLINSSVLTMDAGDDFFRSSRGGLLSVDYTTRWSNSGFASPQGLEPIDPPGDGQVIEDNETGVIYGEHNLLADPLLARAGEWGAWATHPEVRDYYALLPGSPCIDTGDTLLGFDGDESLPERGRYPYEGLLAEDPLPVHLIAQSLVLGQAFPNPFNASTVIPFALRNGGIISVNIVDINGRQVESVNLGTMSAGEHSWSWNAVGYGTGTYFLTASVNGRPEGLSRLVLLK